MGATFRNPYNYNQVMQVDLCQLPFFVAYSCPFRNSSQQEAVKTCGVP